MGRMIDVNEERFRELSKEISRLDKEWSANYDKMKVHEAGYNRIRFNEIEKYATMSLKDARALRKEDNVSYKIYKKLKKKSLGICGKQIKINNKIKRALQ